MAGTKFSTTPIGYWQPLEVVPNTRHEMWVCQCKCGKIKTLRAWALLAGRTHSCGCYGRKIQAQKVRTHGMHKSPEYKAWQSMKQRCHTKSDANYHRYGGRGILVCDRWRESFMNFYNDMGPRPSSRHSLERINNDGSYEPDNCKWATPSEQANNTRAVVHLSFRGQTHSVSEWSRITGLFTTTIRGRLKYNWSIERALITPAQGYKFPFS